MVGVHSGSQQPSWSSAYLSLGGGGQLPWASWLGSLLLPLTQSGDSMVKEPEVD